VYFLTLENGTLCATRLNFRASVAFIIYKWSPIKYPRGKISLICSDTNDKNEDAFQQNILYTVKELELCLQKNDQIINIEKQ